MRAITSPTLTVWPSSASSSTSVPSTVAGSSAFTLSVIRSQSGSYCSMESPGCFSHLPIVADTSDSASCGIITSVSLLLSDMLSLLKVW
ncbi:hypothetical protein D3C75_1217480 [compost metagenome]